MTEEQQIVRDAYYEGFEDGGAQESRYEWGGTPRTVKQCWEDSEAKREIGGDMASTGSSKC